VCCYLKYDLVSILCFSRDSDDDDDDDITLTIQLDENDRDF